MLEAAAKAAEGTQLTVLAVTVLTSLDDGDLEQMGNLTGTRATVLQLAKMAVEAGIKGLVCSAKEVKDVRAAVGPDIILVTPGIRLPEGNADDQKRIVTPGEAIQDGADFLVIGRPIFQAEDPIVAAGNFATAIGMALLAKGVRVGSRKEVSA
jgi:orotidine-5'-phosphate decarboxylase